jgi:hypothetical protein
VVVAAHGEVLLARNAAFTAGRVAEPEKPLPG